jgi:hypothetical protein
MDAGLEGRGVGVGWLGRRLACAFVDALVDAAAVVLCCHVLPLSVRSGEALGIAGYTIVIVRNERRGIVLGWNSLPIATSIRACDGEDRCACDIEPLLGGYRKSRREA